MTQAGTTYRPKPKFDTGLAELGDNLYAYLQWDGGWGISNAGFLASDEGLLVVDALMAPSMTRRFVESMRQVSGAPFRHLVNTHMHPDHTNGNQFIEGAEIVAHAECRREMLEARRAAEEAARQRPPGDRGPKPGWIQDAWWEELADVRPTLPHTTFRDHLTLHYAGTEVELHHYGPAHTFGDSLVYFPASKLLFAGDLAFFYSMPLCRGDMENWVRVCDIIKDMDVETIIPGHGPPGGKRELEDMQEFLAFMVARTRMAFQEGLTPEEAARRIDIGDWAKWPEAERKEMNIATLYRMFEQEKMGTVPS